MTAHVRHIAPTPERYFRDDCDKPLPCRQTSHLHGAFRRRAGLDGEYARAQYNSLGEMETGVVQPLFVARHDDLIGGDLARSFVPSGVIGRHLDRAEKRTRPKLGFKLISTFRHYQPPRAVEGCELTDLIDSEGATRRLADIDAALARLPQKKWLTWNTPRIEVMSLDEALAFGFRDGALSIDAFARMARWRLPGLERSGDTPVVSALRAALWITRTIACPTADALCAFHHEGRIVKRALPLCRPIRQNDRDAARLVLHHAQRIVLGVIAVKPRWRATNGDCFVGDWTIIKAILDEGLSARAVAERLGITQTIVSRRFGAAIAGIAGSSGPLGAQKGKFAVRVRGLERTDKPKLLVRPRPVIPVLADDQWLIDEALQYFGPIRVPAGCAAGYPDEKPRSRAPLLRWNPDLNDDDTGITRHEPGLWTEGRHVKAQRAANWYGIAQQLPAGERQVALANEHRIGRVLNDTSRHERDVSPYHPTRKSESRFAVSFLNAGVDDLRPGSKNGGRRDCTGLIDGWNNDRAISVAMRDPPRQFEVCAPGYDDDAPTRLSRSTDDYCGPAKWLDGKLVPRHAGERDRPRDLVDRIDATYHPEPEPTE